MNASNTSTAQDIGVARDEKEESRLLKFIDELYQQKEQVS